MSSCAAFLVFGMCLPEIIDRQGVCYNSRAEEMAPEDLKPEFKQKWVNFWEDPQSEKLSLYIFSNSDYPHAVLLVLEKYVCIATQEALNIDIALLNQAQEKASELIELSKKYNLPSPTVGWFMTSNSG